MEDKDLAMLLRTYYSAIAILLGSYRLHGQSVVQDNPAYLNFGRSDNGAVTYGEGIWAGWKWYEAIDLKPEFPFGYFPSCETH